MDVNLWAVLVATVTMFAVGAFWYMVPFQSLWGKIHGFDTLSKKQQDNLMKGMGPTYAIQFLVTLISAFVLTHFIVTNPGVEFYKIAFWVWLGFVFPAQVSAVLFGGGVEKKYQMTKVAIMSGEALVRLLLAAWVISLF